MLVNATELKNNLGKYLRDAAREEIIITSNGRKIARLSAYEETAQITAGDAGVGERAEKYAAFPREASYAEFLRLTERSDERYEYIDGEIYLMTSPKTIHQTALGELYHIFANWFQGKKCKPMLAPYDITLKRVWKKDRVKRTRERIIEKRPRKNIHVVQPDLMVICDLEEKLNEKNYYMGVPTLMLEILSESTRGKDTGKKLDLYMSTGVQEYWLVNPWSKEVTVYLFEDLDIAKSVTYKQGETAVSYVFEGLEVRLEKIFA